MTNEEARAYSKMVIERHLRLIEMKNKAERRVASMASLLSEINDVVISGTKSREEN